MSKPDSASSHDLFTRPLPSGYRDEMRKALAERVPPPMRQIGSTLLFRLGGVPLALPTHVASAVAPSLHIARIPHRSGTVLLGLVAAWGDILPCCSLARLLGIPDEGVSSSRTLLLEESAGRRWAFPIDSVIGVRVVSGQSHTVPDDAPQQIATQWTASRFMEDNTVFSLLDTEVLFRQLNLATA